MYINDNFQQIIDLLFAIAINEIENKCEQGEIKKVKLFHYLFHN
jgi:hypothetical protein